MFSRIFLSAALLVSLVGSREMQVLSSGGSSNRACSECRFLAAVCCDESSTSDNVTVAKEACCPTGACCPDGACCVTAATSQVIVSTTKASCCPTGACCPDGPCCSK